MAVLGSWNENFSERKFPTIRYIYNYLDPINNDTAFNYIKKCLELSTVDHTNVLKLTGLSFGSQYKVLMLSPYYSQHNLLTYLRMFRMQKTPTKQVHEITD